MPTICVRISEDERKRLLRYGPLSETVREALDYYLKERRKREVLKKLAQFQKEHPVNIDSDEIVRIIREGRQH